jgi:putative cell wall-binding protein
LLGGKVAVPQKMETGLDGFQVKRLGGNTRYDTNLMILQEAGVHGKDIIVCTGKEFADSLSASAVGLPILLVKDSLNSAQKEFLTGNTGKIYIIGGVNAVSEKAEKQLASYGSVTRLAGATRYKTSVLVAETFFGNPTSVVIAYGENFPDGLSGGPVAYALKSPLILTREGREKDAAAYITAKGIQSGYIQGGTTVLPEKTVNKVFGK